MKVRKLHSIAAIAAGQSAPQGENNYCDNGIPFIKAGNLIELLNGKKENELQKVNEIVAIKHKLKLFPAGTVLFAKSGMSCMKGYVYQLKTPCYVVSHLACVMAKEISGEYLKYYFEFNKPNLLVKDEAYPSISLADIGEMDISYGDSNEQRTIVETLNSINKIIELKHLQLEKLDLLVKSKFIEMFGGVNESNKFQYQPVNNFAKVLSGGTPDRKNADYWQNGTIRWVKTTELQNGIIYDTEEKITEAGMNNSSAKKIPANSILIAMYGQGKTRGMTGYLAVECTTNQACACILPSKKVNQIYLWQFFILSYNKLREMAKGGNQPNLNAGIIKEFPILMPPIELQNEFASFVEQTDKTKSKIKQSLEKFDILKKALMQKYFG